MNKKLSIVFMGNPEFSVPVLRSLASNQRVDLKAVVSNPDRPAGRGQKLQSPPVATFAKENDIKLFQTENINLDEEFKKFSLEGPIDLFIVMAFSQFLKKSILNIPKIGCFNIHTSILPKYRGASPIQFALLNGDKTTGICIQKMVSKMDAGDIYCFKEIKIDKEDNCDSLSIKLMSETVPLVDEFIETLSSDKSFNVMVQDEEKVTYASLISKTDSNINPYVESADKVINKFRAFYVWPGLQISIERQILKIKSINYSPIEKNSLKPGELKFSGDSLFLGTIKGAVEIYELQPQNKPSMKIKDVINRFKGDFPAFVDMEEKV